MGFFLPLLALAGGIGAQYKGERDAEKERRGEIRRFGKRERARGAEADVKDYSELAAAAQAMSPGARAMGEDQASAQTMARLRTLFEQGPSVYQPPAGNVAPDYAQYAAQREADIDQLTQADADRNARLMATGQAGAKAESLSNNAALNQQIIRGRYRRATAGDRERTDQRISRIQPDSGLMLAGQLLQFGGMAGLNGSLGGLSSLFTPKRAPQPPTGISPFR